MRVRLPTCRLSGFPTCWEVGDLESWRGGAGAGRGGRSGRGFLVYPGVRRRARRKRWSSGGMSWPRYGGCCGERAGAPLLCPALGGGWCVPTCQLANFSICRLFDLSGSWRVSRVGVVRVRARAVVGVGAGGRSQARKRCCREGDVLLLQGGRRRRAQEGGSRHGAAGEEVLQGGGGTFSRVRSTGGVRQRTRE